MQSHLGVLVDVLKKLIDLLAPLNSATEPQVHVQRLFELVENLFIASGYPQEKAREFLVVGSPSGPVSSLAAVDYSGLINSVISVGSICANGVLHDLVAAFSSPQNAPIPHLFPRIPRGTFSLEISTLELQVEVHIILSQVFVLLQAADNAETTNHSKSHYTRRKASNLIENISSFDTSLQNADGDGAMGLGEMRRTVEKARSVVQSISDAVPYNEYYFPPSQRSRIYTGREKQIREIQDAFAFSETTCRPSHDEGSQVNKFVIQGMPGVGKTQLALRYAEQTKQQYWAVFWIDAGKLVDTIQGYDKIAKVGGVDRNREAAKHWLSNCPESWLMIIDNAEDYYTLDTLLPFELGRGRVLVTTRNPFFGGKIDITTSMGILGEEYISRTVTLELDIMDANEARMLFLRAARKRVPQPPSVLKLVDDICERLYFLPLALVQAGRAIWEGIVSMEDYISRFESENKRIKEQRSRIRRLGSDGASSGYDIDRKLCPLATFEILHQSLVGAINEVRNQHFKDALELLHILSYMDCRNVRFDMLVQAAILPLREKDAEIRMQHNEARLMNKLRVETPALSLIAQSRKLAFELAQKYVPPNIAVLPEFLTNPYNLSATDLEQSVRRRLREAFGVLVSRGLVQNAPIQSGISDRRYDDKKEQKDSEADEHSDRLSEDGSFWSEDELETDRYYMHPVVHKWVRERPQDPREDSLGHDALLCQKAKSILMSVIPLQGFDSEFDMEMRRDIRPHMDAVRKHDHEIQEQFEHNRSNFHRETILFPLSPLASTSLSHIQALGYAKYARVYVETGSYSEANKLLKKAERFTEERLGIDHPMTHRAKLARAENLFFLKRWNDCVSLLSQVYESQKRNLGKSHPTTLSCALKLAGSVLTQGRIAESLGRCQDTYQRMVDVYRREDHLEPLRCLKQMAAAQSHFWNSETAIRIYQQALDGIETRWLEFNRYHENINDSSSVDSESTDSIDGDKADNFVIYDPKDIPTEEDILSCRVDLARELLKNKSHKKAHIRLAQAEKMLHKVYERRVILSGKEHPLTLMTRASLGLAIATGQNGRRAGEAAAEYMEPTLAIAACNLGKNHLAVLAIKGWYAEVLVLQHGYEKYRGKQTVEGTVEDDNHGEKVTRTESEPVPQYQVNSGNQYNNTGQGYQFNGNIFNGPVSFVISEISQIHMPGPTRETGAAEETWDGDDRLLDKAEELLREASDKSKYVHALGKDGYDIDLIWHRFKLADVLLLRGKKYEALALNEELLDCLPKVGGHRLVKYHPISEQLFEKIDRLRGEIDQTPTVTRQELFKRRTWRNT